MRRQQSHTVAQLWCRFKCPENQMAFAPQAVDERGSQLSIISDATRLRGPAGTSRERLVPAGPWDGGSPGRERKTGMGANGSSILVVNVRFEKYAGNGGQLMLFIAHQQPLQYHAPTPGRAVTSHPCNCPLWLKGIHKTWVWNWRCIKAEASHVSIIHCIPVKRVTRQR